MTNNIISKNSDEDQPHTVARVETNFERLPIWSPKPKRGTTFVSSKAIALEPHRLPDGKLVNRKIEIVPSAKYGYPTVQTQEYWNALQYLWHQAPNDTGKIEFSRRQIIEGVLGKTYGRQTRRALDLSINQLGHTGFTLSSVFYDKEHDTTHKELRQFHLITDLSLTERKKQGEVIRDKCSITLHPLVVSNLLSGYYKPILLSVLTHLKSDTARLLYRKLDSHFTHYAKYEISTERFFREQGILGDDYKYASNRKRILEKAIKELIGKDTSSGVSIGSYSLLKTTDKKDWKLIAFAGKRTKGIPKPPPEKMDSPPKEGPPQQSKDQQPTPVEDEALQALVYFDKVFGLTEHTGNQYSQGVVKKAAELVKQYGLEKVKYLIKYANKKAPETNYKPKTFNGIVKYLDDALLAWEQVKNSTQRSNQKAYEARLKEAKFQHEKAFESDYYEYIDALVVTLMDTYPDEFHKFQCWQNEEREKIEQQSESIRSIGLRVFEKEGQIVLRLCKFFEENQTIHIPDFWEWDKEHNQHGFEKQMAARRAQRENAVGGMK